MVYIHRALFPLKFFTIIVKGIRTKGIAFIGFNFNMGYFMCLKIPVVLQLFSTWLTCVLSFLHMTLFTSLKETGRPRALRH